MFTTNGKHSILHVLFSWVACPAETCTPWGLELQLVSSPRTPLCLECGWCTKGPQKVTMWWRNQSGHSHLSCHSSAANVLWDTVPRFKPRVGKPFPYTSLPLQIPISSLLEHRDGGGKEGQGWKGEGEEVDKRGEGNKHSRENIVSVQCFWYFLFSIQMEEDSSSIIHNSPVWLKQGQDRVGAQQIMWKEPMNTNTRLKNLKSKVN